MKTLRRSTATLVCFLLIFQNLFAQTFNGIGNLPVPPGAPGNTQGVTVSTATVANIGVLGGCTSIDNVTIDFPHTWVGDVAIFLISPNGSVLELSSGNGGSGDNFQVTTFSDLASLFITDGAPPFNGGFRPEGRQTDLNCFCSNAAPVGTFTFANTFNGENADGTWQLYINDYVFADVGILNSWSITFTSTGTGPVANPATIEICLENGSATVDLTTVNSTVNGGTGAPVLWFEDMAATVAIANPTSFAVTGNTTVYAVVDGSGCQSAPVAVTINANVAPAANPASLTGCDLGSGQATFDLTTLYNTINGGTGLPVTFFPTPAPVNPIAPSSYVSSGGTIYAIVLGGLCISAPVPVTLTVSPAPTAVPLELEVCDNCAGWAWVDLTSYDDLVNGGTGNPVTWWTSPQATFEIPNPDSIQVSGASYWATVSNGTCESEVVQISFTNIIPNCGTYTSITACDDGSGTAIFDLTSVNSIVNNGTTDEVTWFEDQEATIPIANPTAYSSSGGFVFAVVDDGICPSPAVAANLIISSGLNPNDISINVDPTNLCGPGSVSVSFTLPGTTSYEVEMQYGNPASGFSTWSQTVFSGDNYSFPITETTEFQLTFVENNISGCSLTFNPPLTQTVTVAPAPPAFPASLEACTSGGGSATFDLTTVNNTVNGGTGEPVNWFTDPGATIPISNPTSYVSSGGIIYAIVLGGSCNSAPAPITLTVIAAPNLTLTMSPFICEGESFDLSTVVSTTSGLPITYHSGTPPTAANELPSPVVSPTATTIYYAFVDAGGGCTATMPIQTFVTSSIPLSLGTAQVCVGAPPFDLSTLNDPAFPLGIWSGPGVAGNFFNPSGQSGSVTLTFDPDAPCGQTTTTTVTIVPGVNAAPYPLDACDDGTGTGVFDLTSIENFVAFGTGNPVMWYTDAAATNPIANPSNYVSGEGVVFATVSNGSCTSAPSQIDLNLVPTPNLANSFITVNPLSLCEPGVVSVTFIMPEGGVPFTVQMDYGDPVNGYQNYIGVNVFDGSAVPFVISETTEFILNTVSVENNGLCSVTFPNPVTVTVTVGGPDLTLTQSPSICQGQSFDLSTVVSTTSGLPITFHTDTPPSTANELSSPVVSPASTSFYYAFIDGGAGCSATLPIEVFVTPSNLPILGIAQICVGEPPLDLNTLTDPVFPTGTWNGPGVTGNFFDPNGQSGPVTLTFDPDDPCGQPTTTTVTVLSAPFPPTPETLVGCDDGNGTATFDLTSIEAQISGGSGPVNWYADPAATIPITNPAAFNSPLATVYATVGTAGCESATAPIDLFFLPALTEQNVSLSITPLSGCGPTPVDITMNVPSPGDYLVNFNYGNPATSPPFTLGDAVGFGPDGTSIPFLVSENTVFQVENASSQFDGVTCFYDLNSTDFITVTVEGPPLSVFPVPPICQGETIDLTPFVDNPETAILTFHSDTPASPSNQFPNSVIGAPGASTTVYVLADNGLGCTTELPLPLTVNPADVPVLSTADICESENSFDLSQLADPFFPGGTWSGPGVSGGFFSASGQNGAVTLTYTPIQNCALPASTVVNVVSSLTPQLGTATLCESADPFPLANLADPAFPNGTWSGPGVSGNTFFATGLSGPIALTFTPTDPCVETTTTNITVSAQPDLIQIFAPEICQNESIDLVTVVTTSSGLPITFHSNDPPTPANELSSTIVSPTATTTYFAFVDGGGDCTATLSFSVDVGLAQTPQLGTASVCASEPTFDLTTLLDPAFPNGEWTGPGVSGDIFQPAGQNGPVTLTFNPDAPCALPAITSIQVEQESLPILASATICANAVNPLDLNTLVDANFPTGTWDGPGVSGNEFFPAGLSGVVTLTFLADGSCVGLVTTTVTITESFVPQLGTASVCASETNFDLNDLLDPAFLDGQWSGLGVNGNTFDATGLSGTVTLFFDPDSPCDEEVTTTIEIEVLASPNLAAGTTCQTSGPFDLSSLLDPAFLTGAWSGPGVNGSVFSPSGQTGAVTLTFTSDDPCALPANTTVNVNETPAIANLQTDCTTLNDEYTITFNITGGDPGSYTVNGQPTATAFVSDPIPSGQPYSFLVDDVNGCGPVPVNGSFNCDCATFAGTMNLTGSPFELCADETFTATANPDAVLDPSDVLVFVLHDAAGPALGNVLATNTVPEFELPPNGQLGMTYYVSAVAANDDGTGSFDPSDACLSVAAGVPVVFYQPAANVGSGGVACATDCFEVPLSFTGVAPFEFSYQITTPSGVSDEIFTSSNPSATLSICPTDLGLASGQISIQPMGLTDANECTISLSADPAITIEILPEPQSAISQTLCSGETLTLGSTTFSEAFPSGTVVLENVAANGCDSTVQVDLQFSPADTVLLDPTLCVGTGLTVNGTFYSELNPAGVEVLTTSAGCDSVVVIALSFDSQVTVNLSETLCPGESITVNGTTYDEANPSGMEVFPGGSSSGCDSVVNVALSYFPAASGQISEALCTGGSLTVNGTLYDETNPTGTEILANASVNGCDSTVTVSLTFSDEVTVNLSETLCPGEAFTVNGTTYNEANPSGTEVFPGGSSSGCDSVVNVALSYFPAASGQISEALCTGGSLTVNGTLYDEANPTGTEILSNASVNGCDSTVTVSLVFLDEVSEDFPVTLCEGETLEINGETFDETNPLGQQVFPGGSVFGCDSVLNISLTFLSSAEFELIDTLTSGNGITVNGTEYSEANPNGVEVIENGAVNGCDSTVFITLFFENMEALVFSASPFSPTCEGDSDGQIVVENIAGGSGDFTVAIGGQPAVPVASFPFVFDGLPPGNYDLTVSDGMGLSATVSVVIPSPVTVLLDLGEDLEIELGDNVSLNAVTNIQPAIITWQPTTYLDCDDCLDPVAIQPTNGLQYTLTITDENGCTASDEVQILVRKNRSIFVPNAFSPNGDGINDVAMIFAGDDVVNIASFRIFDRWGGAVFEGFNLRPNDLTLGWDGMHQGDLMNPAVFVYFAEVEFVDGVVEMVEGEVVLVR